MFIGRTDAEAEAPFLWPPDVRNWLNGKDPEKKKKDFMLAYKEKPNYTHFIRELKTQWILIV